MNDEFEVLLKELKAEKAKITALIERCQEAKLTAVSRHIHELTKLCGSSPTTTLNANSVLSG